MRLLAALILGASLASSAAQAVEADLELVLAVDASASVDEREFALQLGGIEAAMRDPEVLKAIAEGPIGRIGLTVVIWADATLPKQRAPWHLVANAAACRGWSVAAPDSARAWRRRSAGWSATA